MNVILIICAMMVYLFIGALIGFFMTGVEVDWAAFMAVFWPAYIILMMPIMLADHIYTKIKRWRLSRK